MAKIVDLEKYRNRKAETKKHKRVTPENYTIEVEVNGDGTLTYTVSDAKLMETEIGKEIFLTHMTNIILDMCDDDPELITQLLEAIEDYYSE